jgi:hypothetical protein
LVIRPEATPSPARKPVHAEFMSNDPAPCRPRLAATTGAVAGHFMSGVVVATMTMSMSPGAAEPSMAAWPARVARSEVGSSAVALERAWIPVLVLIHSSLVSIRCASSSFVSRPSGR